MPSAPEVGKSEVVEEPADGSRLLVEYDQLLRPLLPAIGRAVATRSTIGVLSLWRPNLVAPLIVSHLHLRWPGQVEGLPLTPVIAVMPFSRSDWDLTAEPIYSVNDTRRARQLARVSRHGKGKHCSGDLHLPDWEQALERKSSKLENLILPAESFLSFDRVTATGELRRGNRRLIGRIAPRGELKPQVLVPAELELESGGFDALATADVVILNAQNLRGRRTFQLLKCAVQALRNRVPLVVLAASPADLDAVGFFATRNSKDGIITLSEKWEAITTHTATVGQERLSAEREFAFSLEGLEERQTDLLGLMALARRAWWAARQMISCDVIPREVSRFQSALENGQSRQMADVGLLNEAKRLIDREVGNSASHEERLDALANFTLHDRSSRDILVITGSGGVRDAARGLAKSLGVTDAELPILGVQVCSVFEPTPLKRFDACIASGYFGPATIDMVFASKATRVYFVVDPIEARIAIWDLQNRFRQFSAFVPKEVESSFLRMGEILERHAAQNADTVSLTSLQDFGLQPSLSSGLARPLVTGLPANVVSIFFTDGLVLEATANTRFVVFGGRRRLALKPVAAKDLKPGNQVVLVEQESREAFAETIMNAVDEGRYKKEAATRKTWLTLVRTVCAGKSLSATVISRRLRSAGLDVDPTTVRNWMKGGNDEDLGVPERLDWFKALARAIELSLPDATLEDWFRDIRRLRVAHRNVGRDLAKAIKGVYLGQLDAPTLAKIDRDWGVQARELISAARVATVDDIWLSEAGDSHDS